MLKKLIRIPRNYLAGKINTYVDAALIRRGYVPISDTVDQDIFIIGFPKSGNTWMQHLMTGILFRADMSMIQNNLVRELVPDEHQAKLYRRFASQMCFKSHSLPAPRYKKVIYIVRDGRDAYVSFFNMKRGMKKNISLEDIMRTNKGLLCSWNDHVQSWISNPHSAEICFVRYEDLKTDPFDTLKKVCGFLKVTVPDTLLTQIITNCSFEEMRKKEEGIYWEKSKKWKEGGFFVRKGIVGGYKNEIAKELLDYFEEESGESLTHFGYK